MYNRITVNLNLLVDPNYTVYVMKVSVQFFLFVDDVLVNQLFSVEDYIAEEKYLIW